jgi:hypothetical protein
MQALTVGEKGSLFALMKEEIRTNRSNKHAEVNISVKTIQRFFRRYNLRQVKAKFKNSGRINAYNNIRTPLSFCCLIDALQKFVNRVNYHSVDDVSILANPMNESLKVITTQEAIDHLADLNQCVSIEEKASKQRVVTFNCTISGHDLLTVTCIKFADRSLEQFSSTPRIFKLEEKLYICLYKYGMDEEILNRSIYMEVILPEVISVRNGHLTDQYNQSEEKQELFKYAAIAQDGAYGQIKAIETTLHPYTKENNLDIFWAKYAGGASLSQSPNDKGMMHSTLHTLFKSTSFHYGNALEPVGGAWALLKSILRDNLDSASYTTVWKVMTHARNFLQRSFNPMAIRSAYEKTGIFCEKNGSKYSPEVIMGHCPHYNLLPDDDAKWVLGKIPELCSIFLENSYIPEDSFNLLHERPNVDNSQQVNLNDLVTNRQRCLIIGANKLKEHQILRTEPSNPSSKKTKGTKCFNPTCFSRNVQSLATWKKCKVKNCRIRSCEKEACENMLHIHEVEHRIHG